MAKQRNVPLSFNKEIAKARLNETFIYGIRSILDESESLIEAKERIMFQIMQDVIEDQGNYFLGKKYIDKMILKLKHLSE